jgi:hypothetical protein
MSSTQPALSAVASGTGVTAGGNVTVAAAARDIIYQGFPQTQPGLTLDAALETLNRMPIDTIPERASVPSQSRIVLGPNDVFVGRGSHLCELAAVLKGGSAAAIGQTAVASGMGGIGKTQLACEFVHRYGQFFAGGVYWLSFANPDAIEAEIASCGGRGAMDLPNFDALPLEQQVATVRARWEEPWPRLLVLDNCEDPRLVVLSSYIGDSRLTGVRPPRAE